MPDEDENSMVAVATEVQRLGEALITRQLDPDQAAAIADKLAAINHELSLEPIRSKADNFGLRNRIATFLETRQWPPPPADGSRLEFDVASPVGGELNPFSIGAEYFRDGDEVVGKVNVGRCFEGPPERVHGGLICAIFDEVMGSVFRATGTASAFTGELSVRFEAPAPISTDLVFRARVTRTDGRKRILTGEASSPDGQFASAIATFVEMRLEHFPDLAVSAPASAPE